MPENETENDKGYEELKAFGNRLKQNEKQPVEQPAEQPYERKPSPFRKVFERGAKHARNISRNVATNTNVAVKKVVTHELKEREKQHRYPYSNPKGSTIRKRYHLHQAPGIRHQTANPYWQPNDFSERLMGEGHSHNAIDLLGTSDKSKKIKLI